MVWGERSQSQKTTYCMTLFIWNVHKRQIYRDMKWISACLGLGGGAGNRKNREWLTKEVAFLFGVMKMCWNWLWWWLYNLMNILTTTELYFIKGGKDFIEVELDSQMMWKAEAVCCSESTNSFVGETWLWILLCHLVELTSLSLYPYLKSDDINILNLED